MRRFLIVLMTTLMVIGVCGCTMGRTNGMETQPTVTLTQRQIRILEQEGLSTVYEELSIGEREAIMAIEEMMTAVESKYGVEFEYISYTDGGILDSEELTIYPKSGDRDTDIVCVRRTEENGAYVYEDDYEVLLEKPKFEAMVQDFVQERLGEGSARVFSIMFVLTDGGDSRIDGDSWVFIDGGMVDQERFGAFASEFEAWMAERGITGSAKLILLKPDTLKWLTAFNYSDYLADTYCIERISCKA